MAAGILTGDGLGTLILNRPGGDQIQGVTIVAHDILAVVSATVVDSWGTEASAPAYALADGTTTINEAIAEAQAYVKALDGVTDGFIRKMHVQFVPALPTGLKTGAVATGAKVEQTGVVNFGVT